MRGTVCVMVAHGTPCLGPVTHAGCGALCPTFHRGCYGCFGPAEDPNVAALAADLERAGMDRTEVVLSLRTYNAGAGAVPVRLRGPGRPRSPTAATGPPVLQPAQAMRRTGGRDERRTR